jgi:bile acid-coenzyme A ligase
MAVGNQTNEPVSFGRRLSQLAAVHPEKAAIHFASHQGAERTVSYAALDRDSTRLARLMAERGVDERSMVVVGLPNCPEHFIATYAAWKLGALVLPMRAALPARERDQILALGQPTLIVAEWADVPFPIVGLAGFGRLGGYSDAPLPDRIPHPGKAIGSGGSTGRPKIIVDPAPLARVPGGRGPGWDAGLRPGQVQLVPGPLYHNSPFGWSHMGLFDGHTLVLMERFDAARAVDLIERHRVNFVVLVPTMMRRIAQLPDIQSRDLSSIQGIMHTAAPCPPWVKRAWIDLIGGERVFEGFGAAEAVGVATIRGDEWLLHPGSVGTPKGCDLRILDERGDDVPSGEMGEIFMRPHRAGATYEYIGSPAAKSTPDGYMSVGDMGWVDAEGYLFLADRRVDLIITGGANVYPAEVEAALTEHAAVADVAVIGVPDDDFGKRVHAIIQPRDPAHPPAASEMDVHCRERLASYKVPKQYEFLDLLPRDDAGKLRRSALAAERAEGPLSGTVDARGQPVLMREWV